MNQRKFIIWTATILMILVTLYQAFGGVATNPSMIVAYVLVLCFYIFLMLRMKRRDPGDDY